MVGRILDSGQDTRQLIAAIGIGIMNPKSPANRATRSDLKATNCGSCHFAFC